LNLAKPNWEGYLASISLGCPSGLRGLAEINPSNLIRIMPAEGLRDDERTNVHPGRF
jgi:hypothetical protein